MELMKMTAAVATLLSIMTVQLQSWVLARSLVDSSSMTSGPAGRQQRNAVKDNNSRPDLDRGDLEEDNARRDLVRRTAARQLEQKDYKKLTNRSVSRKTYQWNNVCTRSRTWKRGRTNVPPTCAKHRRAANSKHDPQREAWTREAHESGQFVGENADIGAIWDQLDVPRWTWLTKSVRIWGKRVVGDVVRLWG